MEKIIKGGCLLTLVFAFIFMSCSENEETIIPEPEPEPTPIDTVFTVNRENQYALNVVFFKPSDYIITETMMNNVSDMMLFIQSWYEKQMELQGYGKKTFGLMTKNGKVNIILIEAPEPSWYYDTDAKIMSLVEQHFADFPEDKQGDHTFVLGERDSGVGFHGRGRWAFATSSDKFRLTPTGKYIDNLELLKAQSLGGIMHELGHCLNLNHNCHKASDLPNIALLAHGNHIYQSGQEEYVFLTKASCAILDVNQVFNTKDKEYYKEDLSVSIKSYSVTKDDAKKATVIQGVVGSDINLTEFFVAHDGAPYGGNNAYDKITWADQLIPTENPNEYSFYVETKYEDLFNNKGRKDSLMLTLEVIAGNGKFMTLFNNIYTMNEATGEPNDNILKDYEVHNFSDRSNWMVITNSVADGTTANNMIDGDSSTNWMSSWPYSISNSGSHTITAYMGGNKTVNGIYWLSVKSGNQFRPKHVIIETSTDRVIWTEQKDVTIPSMEESKECRVKLDTPVSAQYFRLIIDQVHSDNTTENLNISELDIL